MHWFQNNLAQLFIWNISLCKLKDKVTLEGQTIKRSLASVNWNFWFINFQKKVWRQSMMLFGFCLINAWITSSHAYRSLKQMAGSTSCPWTTVLVIIYSTQLKQIFLYYYFAWSLKMSLMFCATACSPCMFSRLHNSMQSLAVSRILTHRVFSCGNIVMTPQLW